MTFDLFPTLDFYNVYIIGIYGLVSIDMRLVLLMYIFSTNSQCWNNGVLHLAWMPLFQKKIYGKVDFFVY